MAPRPPDTTVNEPGRGQPVVSALEDEELEELVGDNEYVDAFGENLDRTLDVETWATGPDWEGAIARLKTEILSAAEREEELRPAVRQLLRKIGERPGAPQEAGVYRASPDEIAQIHEGLLFPGRVEAVDGTSASHDTLPLGITQIGIAIVSYGGVSATFSQRVFRKEITGKPSDPVKAALEIINSRDSRSGVGQKDQLAELARRGIMSFAERKI